MITRPRSLRGTEKPTRCGFRGSLWGDAGTGGREKRERKRGGYREEA